MPSSSTIIIGRAVCVVCQSCAREVAYSLPVLIQRHGADAGLPDVLARITADCAKRQDWRQHGPCQGHFPDLGALAAADR